MGCGGIGAETATERVDALVLAGGINRIPLFEGDTPGYKALVPLCGRPSILYVLDALKATPQVGRVCIAGPQEALRPVMTGTDQEGGFCAFAAGGETLTETISHGLEHFADARRVLVLTADLPLLTPRAIEEFLAACERTGDPAASLFLSVVPRRCYTGPYERFTKPFNRFRDVEVCHGNLWLVDPRILQNARATDRIDRVYRARKNPIATALAVGLPVGLVYVLGVHLLHALTLARMTRIASRYFGVVGESVLVEHPEITMDVDEPDDYQFVLEQLCRCGS
jgi:GTP:adenosylcobinamide-phosphate guanylyltransferase